MSQTAIEIPGLMRAEYFDMHSTVVNDTFRIFVAKPPFAPPGKQPAIFVTDANMLFFMTANIQRMLTMAGENPAAYVIGIGYPTERGFFAALAKRHRDLVPTDGGGFGKAVVIPPAAPGGKEFLRYLDEELKPLLKARYSIDESDSTYIGSSLGGLFGTWTLLNAPSTFQRYVLASPSLSWNDEEVWQWEGTHAESHRDLAAKIFVSAGSHESPEHARNDAVRLAERNPFLREQVESMITWCDQNGWPRATELPREFAEKLQTRKYSSLKIHHHIMPDETHISVTPSIITRGLRYVFDQWHP